MVPRKWIHWEVKYFPNCLKINVGITLIGRKAILVSKHDNYGIGMALFKFGRLTEIHRATKLKSAQGKPCSLAFQLDS